MQLVRDQQRGGNKQAAKPPVKTACIYTERKVHYLSFSYHGGVIVSAHLTVSFSCAETVEMQCMCATETQWGIC